MLIKVILIFLLAMVALAFIGRLRLPAAFRPQAVAKPTACKRCGRFAIEGTCDCRNPPTDVGGK
jgi:hypothetical protein